MKEAVKNSDNNLKISVITVSYNCEDTIAKTMQSVLSQTYTNLEYLIIDGCSTDNTHNVVREIMDKRTRLFIEKDNGIYDAMNKGFRLATGDVIYYLNSGDYLANEKVLEDVNSGFLSHPGAGIVYGDVIRYNEKEEEYMKMERKTALHVMTRCICHQGIFAKRSAYHDEKPFDEIKYPVYADFDWILREVCYHDVKMFYLNGPVVYYLTGGFSEQEPVKKFSERLEFTKKYFIHDFKGSYLYKCPFEFGLFVAKYLVMMFLYKLNLFRSKKN